MTDTEVVVAPTPQALPKSTTPDDLLKMYDDEPAASKNEITEEAEKQVKIKEEVPKLEAAKKLSEVGKTLPDSEEVVKEEQPKEEVPKEAPYKAFKGKFGDEDISIPEEAEVIQKIAGKDVPVKVRDAIQAYTKQEEFNRNMDRRLSHVSAREKKWEADQSTFKDKIGKVLEVAKAGDFVTGIRSLAKLATAGTDLDVTEFEKQYFAQLDKVREVYSKMSQEQRDAYFAQRKAKDLEETLKKRTEEDESNKAKSQLQTKVQELQKQHNIPEEEFWGQFEWLKINQVGEGKLFASEDDISPDHVVAFTNRLRHESKVADAGQKLGIEDEGLLDEVSKLTLTHPEWSVDDIVSVIEKSGVAKRASASVVENLNRKAEKSNLKPQSNQANSTKKQKTNGLDDEDLNFLYRQAPRTFRPAFR